LEIHYHPGKANVVADALSRKASCHCLTMKASDISLCQEMEKLNLGMIQHGTLNHLKLESVLLQRIIDVQRNNEGMKHIHEKIKRLVRQTVLERMIKALYGLTTA
jgi:hypothetical protein